MAEYDMPAIHGPRSMTATEARALLLRLGWAQTEAARRLGVSPRMMRHYLALEPGRIRHFPSSAGELPPKVAELLRRIAREEKPHD
jgi:predicted transcriptional regulator